MKNKFIFIALIFFIIFSFWLSSFSFVAAAESKFEFDYNNEHFSFPDFERAENVIVYRGRSRPNELIAISFDNSVDLSKFYYNTKAEYLSQKLVSTGGAISYYRATYNIGYSTDWYNTYPNYYMTSTVLACDEIIYSNFDVMDEKGNIFFHKPIQNAFIENKEQIETGKFDKVIVNAADYTSNELYLLSFYYSENTENPFDTMLPRKTIPLKLLNNFYVGTKSEKAIYEVPLAYTGIDLKER